MCISMPITCGNVLEKTRVMPELQLIVGEFSTSPSIDVAGATMLKELQAELSQLRIRLRLAEPRANVRDLLRAAGLEDQLGGFDHRRSLDNYNLQWSTDYGLRTNRSEVGGLNALDGSVTLGRHI
jgi:hypothetical protein